MKTMTKDYFYGLLKSYETGKISPFFRHGTKKDRHIDAVEWGVCQQDINVVECFKLSGLTRKQATAIFHEYEDEFAVNGFKSEKSIAEEWWDALVEFKGNIPQAVKKLEDMYGKDNLPSFVG